MKILLISGIFPPDIGGPATFISGFAEYLTIEGHQVTVIALADSKNIRNRREFKFKTFLVCRDQFKPIRVLKTIFMIRKLSKKSEITLVNGLFYEHYFANIFKKNKYIYKVVGDPVWEKYRNTIDQSISIEDFQNIKLNFKYKFIREILNRGLKSSKKNVVPGFELQKIVENWNPVIRVTQVNNGVPTEMVEGVDATHDVISVTRLVNWKNIDLLIKACHSANLSLIVVGDGPERMKLEALAAEIKAHVDFVGEKNSEEVRKYLHRASVYALVSSYEGMSFSLLEAMMQQREIVVSRVPANLNVIEHGYTGHVIRDWSVDSISKSLTEAKNHLPDSCAMNARKVALVQYSVDKINQTYLEILKDATSQ
jgi:glycosyltransferase involved in cell wall biosynthesis